MAFTPLMIISTAMSAAGSLYSGIQASNQAKYEGAVAGQNAEISRKNAAAERLAAQAAEEAQRRVMRRDLGRSAAAISEAGIGAPGEGTAGLALKQAATEAELDALNIRYGGQSRAAGFEVEAFNYEAQRTAAKSRARGALISGILGAGSAALSGFADYTGGRAARSVVSAQRSYYSGRIGPARGGSYNAPSFPANPGRGLVGY